MVLRFSFCIFRYFMTITYLLAIPILSAVLLVLPWPKAVTRFLFVTGAVLLALAGWVFVFSRGAGGRVFAFGDNLMMDALAALFVFLIVSLGLLSSIYASGYLFKEGGDSQNEIPLAKLRRYGIFFHVFLFTMLLTVLSNNLGVMWIAIEGTTLASAFLVNVDDKKSSIEAAWKYLILCTVGIALALFGIVLVYYSAISGQAGLAGSGNLLNWTFLLSQAKSLNPEVIKLAFVFVLVGYGTKAGLAPFHSWLPDAHSQAPGPVSALLSGVLLNCAGFGILRFHILTHAVTGSDFSGNLLLFFGILSVAIAVPFILEQTDYKRLLAYSSVEHMGLIMAGFGFGGVWGVYGSLLHVINHAFNKALLFFSSGHLLHQFRTKEIKKVTGIFRTNPFLGSVFFLGILGIAGLPPFSIFVSEFSILSGGFLAGKFAHSALLLVLLVLVFVGFLRHASRMTFGPAERLPLPERNRVMDGVLVAGVLLIVILGIYIPAPFQNLIGEASKVIEGVL